MEINMKQQPVIFLQGKRIYLRPLEAGDLEHCRRWINDPEIRQFTLLQTPIDEIGERAWHENRSRGPYPTDISLAIMLKRGDRLIGNTGLHRINWQSRHLTTGALIGEKDCQNKGYGSEAKVLILQYCFDVLGMHRVCSEVLATNPRSLAYLKKNGYRIEGERREHFFRHGTWIGDIQLGILESEWRAIQKKKKR
jgi:[ribosomal protein S5]-alanine N-acetyltransferase